MAEKTIRVRSTRETELVLLNDQDERHPGGHVLIYGDGKPHEVGDTPRVRELIADGTLRIIEPKETKASNG